VIKPHILIVDDEKIILNALNRAFQASGFSTSQASSGMEAIDILSNGTIFFTAALIDLLMPDIPGLEVIRWLRNKSPKTEIFTMSALNDAGVTKELKKLGVETFLNKPFDDIFQVPKKVQLALQYAEARGETAQD
jgi:CheY-like chemotaxis protein